MKKLLSKVKSRIIFETDYAHDEITLALIASWDKEEIWAGIVLFKFAIKIGIKKGE